MGFQFAHVETYSRSGGRSGKLTIAEIIAEARRSPEASLHVENPKNPIPVFGCDLDELMHRHDMITNQARETLATGKKRAVRKDTGSLFTCVLSHPATPEECRNNPDIKVAVEAWAKDSVQWLRHDLEARGGMLETVIMHIDEAHVHLHAYGLHPSGRADRLHPGKAAKKRAVEAAVANGQEKKTANVIGDKAYVSAMREWQDSYSTDVGLHHGLTRLGPARRRLSRAEWMVEKAAAKSVQQAQMMAAALMQAAKTAENKRKQHETAALKSIADAERQADAIVQDAQHESYMLVANADAQIRKARSIANWLRTFWDGLRISSIRKALWKEVLPVIEGERKRTADAENRLQNEIRHRAFVETKLSNINHTVLALTSERDQLRRQRDRLLHVDDDRFEANSPKIR
jgi:cell division septum initiation protein DivIVA